MHDYQKVLADIEDIRGRLAASTTFRGLGPQALAATGCLALLTTIAQSLMLSSSDQAPLTFFIGWIATAIASVAVIGLEMVVRSRRHHAGLADAMVYHGIQQFLPAGVAGAALAAVLGRFAPETIWILPGMWMVLIGLGLFSAVRSLPNGSIIVAAWYFVAGFAVLMWSAESHRLSPWAMGLPFAIGQILLAIIVHAASRRVFDAE